MSNRDNSDTYRIPSPESDRRWTVRLRALLTSLFLLPK